MAQPPNASSVQQSLLLAPFPLDLVGINCPLTSKASGSQPRAAICFSFIGMRGLHVTSDQQVGDKIIVAIQQSDYEGQGLADTLTGPGGQ